MSDQEKWFRTQDVADAYVKHRPVYSPGVYDAILSFCRQTGDSCDFSLAVDLACGSGQGTVPLTKRFQRVIGLDVSQAQVDRAPKDIPNLSFRVGPAEDLSFLEDDSVDLVTVATALHWMDAEKLYPEVERVLKPGGSFVAYSIGFPVFDDPKAQAIFDNYFYDIIQPYWTDSVLPLLGGYEGMALPFPGWHKDDSLVTCDTWALEDFVGYLSTMSSCQNYLQANPSSNMLDVIRQRLLTEVYRQHGEDAATAKIPVSWEVIMLKGHKPSKN